MRPGNRSIFIGDSVPPKYYPPMAPLGVMGTKTSREIGRITQSFKFMIVISEINYSMILKPTQDHK
jgi:hypothetical protein